MTPIARMQALAKIRIRQLSGCDTPEEVHALFDLARQR
ncbi:hypothetical protein FHX15_004887 [Rhizobium sp. BK650]|nr:hypothetical protein [Rhizobium sp. BK650]